MVLQLYLKEEVKKRFNSFSEKYPIFAKATLLDPRFKKIHIPKALIVSKNVGEISKEMNTMEEFPIPNLDVENDAKVSNTDDL